MVPETSTSPGAGERRDARRGVDRHAARLAADDRDLAGVEAGAHAQPEVGRRAGSIAAAARTAFAAPSKSARKPSPSVAISRPRKRSITARMRSLWARRSFAHSRSPRRCEHGGRVDDVGEHDRREHALAELLAASARTRARS